MLQSPPSIHNRLKAANGVRLGCLRGVYVELTWSLRVIGGIFPSLCTSRDKHMLSTKPIYIPCFVLALINWRDWLLCTLEWMEKDAFVETLVFLEPHGLIQIQEEDFVVAQILV